MNSAFKIVECTPGDALFSEVLRRIYLPGLASQSGNEPDEDYGIKCLVLVERAEAIGRLAVYFNDSLTHAGKPTAQLGNFECINNAAAAKALLDAALDIARAHGAAAVIGPMNGATWNQYRFISGQGTLPRFFTEQSHPGYYPALWQQAGFVPFEAYVSNLAPVLPDTANASAFFGTHGLTVRGIEVDHLADELELLYPLCIDAFAKSPLYSPVSQEKFVSKLMALQPFLSPAFTKIAFDHTGAPAAFILCMPDVLDKAQRTLVLKTVARRPDAAPGLTTALYSLITAEAHAAGFQHIIHAFMHVDNASLRRSQQFEGQTIRQYSLYIQSC